VGGAQPRDGEVAADGDEAFVVTAPRVGEDGRGVGAEQDRALGGARAKHGGPPQRVACGKLTGGGITCGGPAPGGERRGKILRGLSSPCGSNICLMPRSTPISAGDCSSDR